MLCVCFGAAQLHQKTLLHRFAWSPSGRPAYLIRGESFRKCETFSKTTLVRFAWLVTTRPAFCEKSEDDAFPAGKGSGRKMSRMESVLRAESLYNVRNIRTGAYTRWGDDLFGFSGRFSVQLFCLSRYSWHNFKSYKIDNSSTNGYSDANFKILSRHSR